MARLNSGVKIRMLNWAYYPRSKKPTDLAKAVVSSFEGAYQSIDSSKHKLPSDAVLGHVSRGLIGSGFVVESGKRKEQKVLVPVLYGNNGKIQKSFEADAHHIIGRFVVEVEAGRGVTNNQFLKDLFQACMMDEIDYLAIAVRNIYTVGSTDNKDFESVCRFFDTLYASDRIKLPLHGVLLIGY